MERETVMVLQTRKKSLFYARKIYLLHMRAVL